MIFGSKPVALASARYHFDRQLRQKPARFIKSMFWTSVRSRRCSTRRRKVAASSSVRVLSSIATSKLSPGLCSPAPSPIEALAVLRRHAAADLVHRQIFLVGGDVPAIAKGILDP